MSVELGGSFLVCRLATVTAGSSLEMMCGQALSERKSFDNLSFFLIN